MSAALAKKTIVATRAKRLAVQAEMYVRDAHLEFNIKVGAAIRLHRQRLGWTQAFLAEQAGLSPNYIARLERGELGPSLFVADRIVGALRVSLEGLVT